MKRSLCQLLCLAVFAAALMTAGSSTANAQAAPTATACWDFNTDFRATDPAFDGFAGPQAEGAGTNDARVVASNPSPAGGSSLALDGDGDYLWVSNPMPAAGSYTKTMWAYRAGANVDTAWENLYTSGDGGGPHALAIDPSANQELLVWHRDGETGLAAQNTGQVIPTAEWVHIAVVYDANSDTLTTFFNGTSVDVQTNVGSLGQMIEEDTIGSYAAMQSWFNGQLDDVCIYQAALTPTEVDAIANPAVPTLQTCTFTAAGGAIPDDDSFGGLVISVPIAHSATIESMEVSLIGLNHTDMGDMTGILFSPNPALFVSIMNEPGNEDDSNFNGTYTFGDTGTSLFTAAAAAGPDEVVPPGTYRASTSASDTEDLDEQFVGMTTAGTWRVELADNRASNLGGVASIALKFTVSAGGCPTAPPAMYVPLTPARLLDSRDTNTPWGSGETRTIGVTGVAGIPTTGVAAVVLNVTTISPTAAFSWLTVAPTGAPANTTAAHNFGTAAFTSELSNDVVIAKIGPDGSINIANANGSVHLIIDVAGFYSTEDGFGYVGLAPARLLDSRDTGTPWTEGETRAVVVTGSGGIPAAGVEAVVLNVTTVSPTAALSWLTVTPTGANPTTTAVHNFGTSSAATELVNDIVVAKVGVGGSIDIRNQAGSVNLVVDVVGYYASTGGAAYNPLNPVRLVDSRDGSFGSFTSPWAPGLTRSIPTGLEACAEAVIVNVTTVDPSAPVSWLTVAPTGESVGTTAAHNFGTAAVTSQIANDIVFAKTGTNGSIDIHNEAGNVHLVIDLVGYFGSCV